jgi:hypothetical protein
MRKAILKKKREKYTIGTAREVKRILNVSCNFQKEKCT